MHESEQAGIATFLILSGDGIPALTPDHIAALRISASAMAGGQVIEATVVTDMDSLEITSQRSSSFMNLIGMAPQDILRTHLDIYAERHRDMGAFHELSAGFIDGLVALPTDSPESAYEAYAILSQASEDTEARDIAALCIYRLVRADPGGALTLWEDLLKDSDRKVADTARESIDHALLEGVIVPKVALQLIRVYRSAWPI